MVDARLRIHPIALRQTPQRIPFVGREQVIEFLDELHFPKGRIKATNLERSLLVIQTEHCDCGAVPVAINATIAMGLWRSLDTCALLGECEFLDERHDMVLHGCFDEAKCLGSGRAFVQMSGVQNVGEFGPAFRFEFIPVHERIRVVHVGSDQDADHALDVASHVIQCDPGL